MTKNIIIKNPDKDLIRLIKTDCDGGFREFDEFLPAKLIKLAEENDSCFFPELNPDNTVTWVQIQ